MRTHCLLADHLLADHLGEQRRLVEPPRPLPAPVQRHRHQRVGLAQERAPGIRHPAAHGGREVEPVAVFERMHQRARDLVVAHRGAGAVIGRRIGNRFHRQDAGTGIVGERDAEPLAVGRGDERQLGPAGGAQPGVADRLAAGGAKLRQRDVDDQAERRAQRAGDPAKPARCAGNATKPRRPRVCGGEPRLHDATLAAVVVLPQRGHDRMEHDVQPDHLRPAPAARAAAARRAARRVRLSDRAHRRRDGRAAGGGAAAVRSRGRSRHAGRGGAARACGQRQGRHHRRGQSACHAGARRHAGGRRRRGGAAVPRRRARSRGVGAVAAVRQRPAGRAGADQARAARRTACCSPRCSAATR